jgi:hypothetical protein
MHFHLGWLGPTQGFDQGGYYIGDGRYRHIGHQQDIGSSGQENQIVQNAKPDHSVSQEAVATHGHQHELEALKSGSSTDQSRGSQGQTRLRRETLADGEVKPGAERNPDEVTAK